MSAFEDFKDLKSITLLDGKELVEIKGGGDPPPWPDDDDWDDE